MHGHDLKLLIPAALDMTYLNVGTLGPTPGTALAAAAASELEWVQAGPGQEVHYLDAHAKVRSFAHRLERAMPGGVISMTQNNSESLLRVLWGLSWHSGDEVVITDHEHDAVVLSLSALMRRVDIRVRVVSVDSAEGLLDEMAHMVNPRTRLVIMSHVSYLTGWELPVAKVANLIASYPNCRLLVDGAQSLGNIVVEPSRLGADFYCFCGHKWMMAPPGWAALWVRSDRRDELGVRWPLKPRRVDPRILEKGPILEYSDGGDDLEYGTRCWPRISGWSVTWDYFEEEGFSQNAQYQRHVADEAREALRGIKGLQVMDPPDGLSATALMSVICHSMGSGLSDWLLKRNVVVKPQPLVQGVRISWAAFNTADDIESLVRACHSL